MDARQALDRVEGAADAAEAAATRLQQKTERADLDAAGDRARDVAHGARQAVDDLKDDLQENDSDAAVAAKVAQAAAAVEAELQEMAAELEGAAAEGDGGGAPASASASAAALLPGKSVLVRQASRKSTEQAVQELRLLAQKKAARSFSAGRVAVLLWALWAAACLLIVRLAGLAGRELNLSGLVGAVWGVGAAGIYHWNRRRKAERNQRLAMIPGAKGIQQLLHHLPSWLSFRETEKVEWLNAVLAKAWPYYDEAICAEVRAQVEPLMRRYRPPFISNIFFKKLTFGDAPFRVEGVRVDEALADRVQIEVDFRWAGDANIFLAIELAAGGAATRMVPKISNMAVSGTLRVTLAPLLPEIPGFGAATVSMMTPPVIKYFLDFGAAFGGSYSARAIQGWLDPFIRDTIGGMLVWPRRLLVPILDEAVTGPLDELRLRHKGALQVDVLEARGLPKMDAIGSADPYVEIYTTDPHVVEKTSVKKNTLAPSWGERLWLLVQEPQTQRAHVTVNDVDLVNVKELFRVNLIKGAAAVFNATELIGRASIRVDDLAAVPGQEVDKWVPLGLGSFDDEDGCGFGRGELRVRLTYWPLEVMGGHAEAKFGAVVVTLLRCEDLAAADLPIVASDPFVAFRLNKEAQASPVVPRTLNPAWTDTKLDWFRVPAGERLEVEVFDEDRFSRNELLGRLSVDLHRDVACQPGGDVTRTWALTDVPKEWRLMGGEAASKPSTITLRIQWIPFS